MNKKKRILWFSHTDCGYNKLFNNDLKKSHTGTWTEALLNEFRQLEEFELTVAFRTKDDNKVRYRDNIRYVPILVRSGKNKFSRVVTKIRGYLSWYDEIEDYKSVIEEVKPDLIHIFGTEENFGFIANFTHIPVAISIQGNLTVYSWNYFRGLTQWQLFSSLNFQKLIRFSTAFSF